MVPVQLALHVDQAIGERVRALVELAARLEKPALFEQLSALVLDGEIDPGLVHIALLRHMRVRGALVLDHHIDGHIFPGSDTIGYVTQRGCDPRVAAMFQCKQVDIEDAVLQELHHARGLLVKAVVLRHQGVCAQPAMRR